MVAAVDRPFTLEKTFEITITLGYLIFDIEEKMTKYKIEKFADNNNFTL